MAAEARPLPSDETTPPVTKMYFGATSSLLSSRSPLACRDPPWAGPPPDEGHRGGATANPAVEPPVAELVEDLRHHGPAGNPERHDLVAIQPRTQGDIARREARH